MAKGDSLQYDEVDDQVRAARRMSLLAKYGLTDAEYQRILRRQHHACAICGDAFEKTPHIDHDHKTDKVRGLLCSLCNSGLGMFRDSTRLLAGAIVYLESELKI